VRLRHNINEVIKETDHVERKVPKYVCLSYSDHFKLLRVTLLTQRMLH
jgi:hypothetical protein